MINPKNICVSACVGFFLSFFIGLVSDVRFSSVILRALIFALIFAALCVGLTFLYKVFLSNDNGAFSADIDSSAKGPAVGSNVNIVVDDSTLLDDAMAPKFNVSKKRTEFGKSEFASAKANQAAPVSQPLGSPDSSVENRGESIPEAKNEVKAAQQNASNPSDAGKSEVKNNEGFKPLDLGRVTGGVKENASQSPAENTAASSESAPSSESLDELPDISNFSTDDEEASSEDFNSTDEIVDDSEFASGGKPMREQAISGDTKVMAQAIKTLLVQDNIGK